VREAKSTAGIWLTKLKRREKDESERRERRDRYYLKLCSEEEMMMIKRMKDRIGWSRSDERGERVSE
jgi:hypothetical protein